VAKHQFSAGRCHQRRSSRAALKAAHVFLILGDPSLNLILREESGLGESRSLGSKTLHQKEQKLALLSLGKSLGRGLDLDESCHAYNPYSGHKGQIKPGIERPFVLSLVPP